MVVDRLLAWIRAFVVRVSPWLGRKLGRLALFRPFVLVYGLWQDGFYRYVGLSLIVVAPLVKAFQSGGVSGLAVRFWEMAGGAVVSSLIAVKEANMVDRGFEFALKGGFPFFSLEWPYGVVAWKAVSGVLLIVWVVVSIRLLWTGVFGRDESNAEVFLVSAALLVPVVASFVVFGSHEPVPFESVQSASEGVLRFVRGLPLVGDEVEAVNQSVSNVWNASVEG